MGAGSVPSDMFGIIVGNLQASYGVSERGACDAFPSSRATIRY